MDEEPHPRGIGFNDLPLDVVRRCLALAVGDRPYLYYGLASTCRAFQTVSFGVLGGITRLVLTLASARHIGYVFALGEEQLVHYMLGLVRKCDSLQELDLSGCSFLSDAHLREVFALRGATLRALTLDDCTGFSVYGLLEIKPRAISLQELSVKSMTDAVGTGGDPFPFPVLASLDLSWCMRVSDDAVRTLGRFLRRLSIRGCDMVTDEGMLGLSTLQFLDIAYTKIGDSGLESLAEGAGELRHLIVSSSYNIWPGVHWSIVGMAAFKAARPDVLIQLV